MKIVATIEARMTSSRLPGKVLMKILNKPTLHYIVKRLRTISSIDEIVLATTVNSSDDVLEQFAKEEGISFFRGSEDDVMGRVLGAADSANADVVVEICGDCPLLDPGLIDQLIETYKSNDVDYVCNNLVRSYPLGMDAQVFSTEALRKSEGLTEHPLDREHVTRHIRNNPEMFRLQGIVAPPNIRYPDFTVTLDEQNDFELIKILIEHFADKGNPDFNCFDIVEALKANNDWANLNKKVQRKGYDS